MNPHWPSHLKVLYVVLTLITFLVMMWAARTWIAEPFGEWFAETISQFDKPVQWVAIIGLPLTSGSFGYLFYRRDHRLGRIASPTFWTYLRTGK